MPKISATILLSCFLVSCLYAQKAKQEAFSGSLEEYRQMVALKVAKNWAYRVDTKTMDKKDEALITLTILRNGEIKEITFVKRAADPAINSSVLTAVRKAEPFPVFPEEYSEDLIEVGIRATPQRSE